MSIVYIPQEPMYKNEANEFVPKFTLDPAKKFGGLRILLPYAPVPLAINPMIKKLKEGLRGFDNFDHILPIGDPLMIGFAVAIASANNCNRVRLLKWDRNNHCYKSISVKGLRSDIQEQINAQKEKYGQGNAFQNEKKEGDWPEETGNNF